MLETYIRSRLADRQILLMTHIVIGYPTLETSLEIVRTMVEAGVDLMELQIPFSEPIADGPVILKANQAALANGVTVDQCLDFGRRVARQFPIPFLYMTYYNILFKHGVDRFADGMQAAGLQGAIVPDLPPEEAADYLDAMSRNRLSPIFIYSPTTSDTRMNTIARVAAVLSIVWPVKGSPVTRRRSPSRSAITWRAAGRPRICPWRWGLGLKTNPISSSSRERPILLSSAHRRCGWSKIRASPHWATLFANFKSSDHARCSRLRKNRLEKPASGDTGAAGRQLPGLLSAPG